MLSSLERRHNVGMSGLQATHALDHHVDVLIGKNLVVVRSHTRLGKAVGQLQNARDGVLGRACGDDLVHASADNTHSQKRNVHVESPLFGGGARRPPLFFQTVTLRARPRGRR